MEPIAHAVYYVEPDGTREVDFKQMEHRAAAWAEWCRQDGCSEVEIHPLYTEEELRLARHSSIHS